MLHVLTQPIPTVGNPRVSTTAAPTAARIANATLATIAETLDAERIEAARREAAEAATAEALAFPAQAMEQAAAALDEARDRAEESLASDAVELAVEIARQIVKVRFEAGEYELEQIVRSTLAASDVHRGQCVVRVHPTDATALEAVQFRGDTVVEADSSLARGVVHLETPRGLLVRDANAALEEIREQLLEDLVA